jgi:hypothetical protein
MMAKKRNEQKQSKMLLGSGGGFKIVSYFRGTFTRIKLTQKI